MEVNAGARPGSDAIPSESCGVQLVGFFVVLHRYHGHTYRHALLCFVFDPSGPNDQYGNG